MMGEYDLGQQFQAPYPPAGVTFANASPHLASTSFVPAQKHDDIFAQYTPIATSGPTQPFAPYYEPHGPLHSATVMHGNEYIQNHPEAQYIFHDIDPTTSYLDAPVYSAGQDYVW
jgi:hypothetical protein